MELMQASRQWAIRQPDERFVNLHAAGAKARHNRDISRERTVSLRKLNFVPALGDETYGLAVENRDNPGKQLLPTHWALGQCATLAGAPAGYLRSLPAPLAADCLNFGLQVAKPVDDTKLLCRVNGKAELAAATGPNYGRIYNSDIFDALIRNFGRGDGTDGGTWRVPGEFGKLVPVTQDNTTIYSSDRDMFVYLADETNRIEMGGRRSGVTGKTSLARGFFVWNSEVGSQTFGYASFLFDYTCMNRIVWGARDYREIKFRHTSGAPDKLIEQVLPVLDRMHNAPAAPVEATIKAAQEAKLDNSVADFLKNRRYSSNTINSIIGAHFDEEQRPMETLWDVVTGITAHAKSIKWQDERVVLERDAGKVLDLVAVR